MIDPNTKRPSVDGRVVLQRFKILSLFLVNDKACGAEDQSVAFEGNVLGQEHLCSFGSVEVSYLIGGIDGNEILLSSAALSNTKG